jgi:hypothetical protein
MNMIGLNLELLISKHFLNVLNLPLAKLDIFTPGTSFLYISPARSSIQYFLSSYPSIPFFSTSTLKSLVSLPIMSVLRNPPPNRRSSLTFRALALIKVNKTPRSLVTNRPCKSYETNLVLLLLCGGFPSLWSHIKVKNFDHPNMW